MWPALCGERMIIVSSMAMGSPVSAVIANMVMEDLEERTIPALLVQPRVWFRYVDDTFVICHSDEVGIIHEAINKTFSSINFTIEEEKNGALPFLDTLVARDPKGALKVTVYRKPTHTDRYLDFNSCHPMEHKRSVVHTLSKRARELPSTFEDKMSEVDHLQSVLRANGYPDSLLPNRKTIRASPHNRLRPREQPKGLCVLPFVPGVSQRVGRILKSAGVRVCFTPVFTLRQALMRVKDKLLMKDRSGVVYVVPCGCGAEYVGETGRTLGQRITEHQKAFECNYPSRSAIAKHGLKEGHTPVWDRVDILGSTPNRNRRRVLEAWHTEETVTSITQEVVDLPVAFDPLLCKRSRHSIL